MLTSASALRRFATRDLESLLERIASSGAETAAVAARSYVHDNGFAKLVLTAPDESGESLRLHVWPDGEPQPGNIHNHCWDFASIVLEGALEYEEFGLDAEGDVAATAFSFGGTQNLSYELEHRGTVKLRSTTRGSHTEGSIYEMAAETLHRSWSTAGMETMTLLARGPRRRSVADVYVTRSEGVPTEVTNLPLSEPDVAAFLRRAQGLVTTVRI